MASQASAIFCVPPALTARISLHLVVILGHIHRRPRSAVDDGIRLNLRNNLLHSFFVGNIQIDIGHVGYSRYVRNTTISPCNVGTNTFMTSFIQFIHHVMA